MKPSVCDPARPVKRAPANTGTAPSSATPMRLEKNNRNGGGSQLFRQPISKMPAFSRKKSRLSGKKRSKRVRFTCSSSTSTCAKSVLSVASNSRPGRISNFTSSPRSSWPSVSRNATLGSVGDDTIFCEGPPSAYGFTSRFIPTLGKSLRPYRCPARLTRENPSLARDQALHNTSSFLRLMTRYTFNPHGRSALGGNRKLRNGIANSADQPSAVRCAATVHTPRQSTLNWRPSSVRSASNSAPLGFVANTTPLR